MARTFRKYKDSSYAASLNKARRNTAVRQIPIPVCGDDDNEADPSTVLRSRQICDHWYRW